MGAKQNQRKIQQHDLEEKIAADNRAESKREESWALRDERQEQKAIRLQAARTAVIDGEHRKEQCRLERQREAAYISNMARTKLWTAHQERETKRQNDQQAAILSVQKAKEDAREAALEILQKSPKKTQKPSAESDEKMNAVEQQMREKMEKQGEENKAAAKRGQKMFNKQKAKTQKEVDKLRKWKDDRATAEEQKYQQMLAKTAAFMDAEKARRMNAMVERDRQSRLVQQRNRNTQRRANERIRKLVPEFKPKPNEFNVV